MAPAFGAPAPDPAPDAAKMAAASAPNEIADARITTVKNAPTAPVDRNNYGRQVAAAYKPLLANGNPLIQLNAAIAIAQIGTISTDAALRDMLKHPTPEIRYWGAKGLGNISEIELKVGAKETIEALRATGKAEKSGVVLQEILRSQIAYSDFDGILDTLDNLIHTMEVTMSDRSTIDAVKLGLDAIDTPVRTSAEAVIKTRVAYIAACAASFTAQQAVVVEASQKAIGQDLTKPYIASTTAAITSAFRILSSATGTTFRTPKFSSPSETLLDVYGVTGNGTTPGSLQKAMPAVKVPPTIKAGT